MLTCLSDTNYCLKHSSLHYFLANMHVLMSICSFCLFPTCFDRNAFFVSCQGHVALPHVLEVVSYISTQMHTQFQNCKIFGIGGKRITCISQICVFNQATACCLEPSRVQATPESACLCRCFSNNALTMYQTMYCPNMSTVSI